MVCWRCLGATGFITLFIISCGNSVHLSRDNSNQLQDVNVAQLLIKANDIQKAEDFFKIGNDSLNSRRYSEAIVAYDKALLLKPRSAEVWINRGNALTALQRYQEALASYDKAIAISPKHEAWFNQGNALSALQRYSEALASYDKAIAISPKHEAWINRGIVLAKLQRYKEALASYDKAIAISPNNQEAYYNKACAYALQNNVKLATENLGYAIKLSPHKYQKLAKTDRDFDLVRSNKQFQELIE